MDELRTGWVGITADGYGIPIPCALAPSHWLAALHPSVHGFTLSSEQVRTDDYLREAVPLILEGDVRANTPAELFTLVKNLQQWVRRFVWLQRPDDGWVTPLAEGNDLEFQAGDKAHKGKLRVVLVQSRRVWISPDGLEVVA